MPTRSRKRRASGDAPILRWAGSKQKQLPSLARYWSPRYERYIEAFAGSACLFFYIGPEQAKLGDLNADLIETYMALRRSPRKVYAAMQTFPAGETSYYRVRKMRPGGLTAIGRAARFIYLNRHCFNGIFRTNQDGDFNVPYGGRRAGVAPTQEEFLHAARALRRAQLTAGDFQDTLQHVRSGDFVYLDPPYFQEDKRTFRDYGPNQFGRQDLDRLIDTLSMIDGTGAHFLLSYADCERVRRVTRKWNQERVNVRRHVAGFASHRRSATELLISNCEPGP